MIKLNVIHIRMIKFRVIKFNQNAWLKPYIDMNIDVSFCKWKTMENVRKDKDIILVTLERRRDYLVSEPNYYTKTFFTENVLAVENEKN